MSTCQVSIKKGGMRFLCRLKSDSLHAFTIMKRTISLLLVAVLLLITGCSAGEPWPEDTYFGDVYSNGVLVVAGGGGNVSTGANIVDNAVVRGDGGAHGIQDSLVTINDFGTLNAPAVTAGNIDSTGKVEADRLIGKVEGFSVDVVQSSNLDIALNDTTDLVFLFEPQVIVLDYSGRSRHDTTSEAGHTTGHCVITRTGVDAITVNNNYTAFVDVNGAMGCVSGQNDTTNSTVVYGGYDGVTDAYFYGVGTWVSATHTLTLTFSTVSDTITAFNYVEILAVAYR